MIEQNPHKDIFHQSTNYNTNPNTIFPSFDSTSISECKQYISKSKHIITSYVAKVFNDIKNHAVRFQITKINSSYTMKTLQKEGVYNLCSFIQNLLMFYKKSTHKSQTDAETVSGITNFIKKIKDQLSKSKQELQSDSAVVQNIQKISYTLTTTMEKLLECFQVRNLSLTDYLKYAQIFKCLIGEIRDMIEGENFLERIGMYDPYSLPTIKPRDPMAETIKSPRSLVSVRSEQSLRSKQPHFYPKQRIHFNKQLPPEALDYIYPSHHRIYICEAAKAYSTITPVRINKINIDRFPKYQNYDTIFDICNESYFQGEQTIPIIYHPIPNTNKMSFYNLDMIHQALNITHEYESVKEMPMQGNFSEFTRSCITSYGSIFFTNISTTTKHYDLNFWQYKFNTNQIKKRVPIPSPRKQHAMIFLNNTVFLIGGSNSTAKALKTVDKYNIKTKQWSSAGALHVGVTNPTVCTFRNRYIFSCCGLNEFDFISNRFEVYDSIYDGWSIVKTATSHEHKSLQLLNGGSAVAINPEVIFIFGGNRSTGFQHDTDMALIMNEIVEVKKKPSRISAELVPTGGEKRSILSYAGTFKPNSGVIHKNNLYFLRKDIY